MSLISAFFGDSPQKIKIKHGNSGAPHFYKSLKKTIKNNNKKTLNIAHTYSKSYILGNIVKKEEQKKQQLGSTSLPQKKNITQHHNNTNCQNHQHQSKPFNKCNFG